MSTSFNKIPIRPRGFIPRPTSAKSLASFSGSPRQVERTKTQSGISRTGPPKSRALLNRPITPPAYKVDSDGSVHIIEPKMDRVDVDVDVDEDQLSDTTEPNLFDSASSSTSIASSIVSKANFVTSTPYSKNKIERVVNEEETGDAVVDSIEDARNGGVEDLSSFSISGATLMPPSEPIEITGHTQFETDPETVNMDLMVAEENTERSESPTAKWRSAFSSIFHLLILVLSIVNVISLIHMYGRILLLEDEIQQLERVCYENRSNYPVGKPESTAIVPFVFGWTILHTMVISLL